MKNYLIIVVLATGLINFIGCDLTSSVKYEKHPYIITGLLNEGEFVTEKHPIFIGKTISADGGKPSDLFVPDSLVEIYLHHIVDNNGNATNDSVKLSKYNHHEDIRKSGYYDKNKIMKIQAGHTYQIKAKIAGKMLSAKTIVPDKITLPILNRNSSYFDSMYVADTTGLQNWPKLKLDDIPDKHHIVLKSTNDNDINIGFEVYCLEEYTSAKYIDEEEANDESGYPESQEDYENEIHGGPRKIKEFFSMQPSNKIAEFRSSKLYYTFYGKHKLKLYSVDDNYHKYNYTNAGHTQGGIKNGLGYFGSRSGKEFFVQIIE